MFSQRDTCLSWLEIGHFQMHLGELRYLGNGNCQYHSKGRYSNWWVNVCRSELMGKCLSVGTDGGKGLMQRQHQINPRLPEQRESLR